MRRPTLVIAVLLATALTLIEPVGADPTPWAKLHRPAAPVATRAGSRMPGQPNRSAHRLEADQHLRRLRDRARAGLSRPRRIGWDAACDARHSVRRSLGGREGLLVRAAELSRAGADPRSPTGRPAVAQVQRSQGPSARAAHRAQRQRDVARAATRKPWRAVKRARPRARLLRSADRRGEVQSDRGLYRRGFAVVRRDARALGTIFVVLRCPLDRQEPAFAPLHPDLGFRL